MYCYSSYDKIRVVGKGAFGQAVLYCRKSDGLMSIIKEVNMLDLVKILISRGQHSSEEAFALLT